MSNSYLTSWCRLIQRTFLALVVMTVLGLTTTANATEILAINAGGPLSPTSTLPAEATAVPPQRPSISSSLGPTLHRWRSIKPIAPEPLLTPSLVSRRASRIPFCCTSRRHIFPQRESANSMWRSMAQPCSPTSIFTPPLASTQLLSSNILRSPTAPATS